MDPGRWITHDPLDPAALVAELRTPAAGALVVFEGTVRDVHAGRAVASMAYDGAPALAARVLQELEHDAVVRFGVLGCRIRHRLGHLDLTETSVIVAVAAAHRGPAFDAARWALDTLKERLPVWKQEHYVDGDPAWLDGTPLVEPSP